MRIGGGGGFGGPMAMRQTMKPAGGGQMQGQRPASGGMGMSQNGGAKPSQPTVSPMQALGMTAGKMLKNMQKNLQMPKQEAPATTQQGAEGSNFLMYIRPRFGGEGPKPEKKPDTNPFTQPFKQPSASPGAGRLGGIGGGAAVGGGGGK